MIRTLITDRRTITWPSYHIIYEWEDELKATLGLEFKDSPHPANFVSKLCKKIDRDILKGQFNYLLHSLNTTKEKALYFEMHPKYFKNYSNNKNVIPILIDFFDREKVDLLKKYYQHCPYFLVTNLEVVEHMREKNFASNVVHFPMSLPTKYKLNPDEKIDKKYDIVIIGRKNSLLWGFLMQYVVKHPDVEYLFQEQIDNELYYRSSKGQIVGKFHSRTEYIDLIRSARVSFYSTPGIDDDKNRSGGFNPLTPRFLELLAAGCHVLARYPKCIETDFYNMEAICPSIDTYDQFEHELDKALSSPAPIARNAAYLSNHYLANRIKILEGL